MGTAARLRGIILSVAVLLCAAVGPAGAGTYNWNGAAGSNDWYDTEVAYIPPDPPLYVNNWGVYGNPPPFPGPGDNVHIDAGGGYGVEVTAAAYCQDLTIGSDDSLTILNGRALTVHGNSISNGNIVYIGGTSSGTGLHVDHATTTLSGGGSLILSDSSRNIIRGVVGDERR